VDKYAQLLPFALVRGLTNEDGYLVGYRFRASDLPERLPSAPMGILAYFLLWWRGSPPSRYWPSTDPFIDWWGAQPDPEFAYFAQWHHDYWEFAYLIDDPWHDQGPPVVSGAGLSVANGQPLQPALS
jgi:hypothetical protein